jgi:hypothetical protein
MIKKEQTYTFTSPVGRAACTVPQCLYKGALYFTATTNEKLPGVRIKTGFTFLLTPG